MIQSAGEVEQTNAQRPGGEYVDEILSVLRSAADLLASSIKGDTEVVVHDLRRPDASVVKIINGHITGRAVGHALFTGPSGTGAVRDAQMALGAPREIRIINKYRAWAGERPLSSTSTVYFDEQGVACAILCTNTDTTLAERLQADLQRFIHGDMSGPAPALENRETGMEDLMTEIIESAIRATGVPVKRMTKAEKMVAVATMHQRGLFLMRGSTELAARALGSTKFTIYNYLEELGVRRS